MWLRCKWELGLEEGGNRNALWRREGKEKEEREEDRQEERTNGEVGDGRGRMDKITEDRKGNGNNIWTTTKQHSRYDATVTSTGRKSGYLSCAKVKKRRRKVKEWLEASHCYGLVGGSGSGSGMGTAYSLPRSLEAVRLRRTRTSLQSHTIRSQVHTQFSQLANTHFSLPSPLAKFSHSQPPEPSLGLELLYSTYAKNSILMAKRLNGFT